MTARRWIAYAILPTFLLACSSDDTAPGEASAEAQEKPSTMEEQASYGIGYNLGRTMRDQGIGVDLTFIRQGVTDGFEGGDALLSPEEMQAAITQLQQEVQARMAQQQEAQGGVNQEQGKAFLAENGGRDGVTTTASGLQYEVMEAGSGEKPSATSKVTVHYKGTLIDGTLFDSSIDRGEPVQFPLNQVIAAWTEGVQLMPVGAKYKFFVPSELGYGASGAGAQIGPHATLIFEVELISIDE